MYAGPAGKYCGAEGSTFTIDRLHPGPYALCVVDDVTRTGCDDFQDAWYGDSQSTGNNDAKRVDVAEGEVTPVSLVYGGTMKVAVQLDNGDPLSGGCLSSIELAEVGAVADCSPVNGVFTFHLTDDYYGITYFSLTGAANAANDSYGIGNSASPVVNAGGTTEVTLKVAAVGRRQ